MMLEALDSSNTQAENVTVDALSADRTVARPLPAAAVVPQASQAPQAAQTGQASHAHVAPPVLKRETGISAGGRSGKGLVTKDGDLIAPPSSALAPLIASAGATIGGSTNVDLALEIGLVLHAVRFQQRGRYTVAFVASNGCSRFQGAFVSREAPSGCEPKWDDCPGVRLPIPISSANNQDPSTRQHVALNFYADDPLSHDRRALFHQSTPHCSCSIWLPDGLAALAASANGPIRTWCLPLLRAAGSKASFGSPASGTWEEIGVVTIMLCFPPASGLASLVLPSRLPDAVAEQGRFSLEDQLTRMCGMKLRKADKVRTLAGGLERLQKALDAVTSPLGELAADRSELAEVNTTIERRLKETTEPELTDLDLDLLQSLRDGFGRVAALLLCAEERWSRARAANASKWEEFKQARQAEEQVRTLACSFEELQAVHAEQRRAILQMQARCDEASTIQENVMSQKHLIERLEAQLQASKEHLDSGALAEVQLELSRLQGQRDALSEQAARLETMYPPKAGQPVPNAKRELNLLRAVQDRTERVAQLIQEVERLQRPPPGGYQNAARAAAAQAEADVAGIAERAGAMRQAVEKLKARHDEVNGKADGLECEARARVLETAHELARLKIELVNRNALLKQLSQMHAGVAA